MSNPKGNESQAPLWKDLVAFYDATKNRYDRAPSTLDDMKKVLTATGVKDRISDKAWLCLYSLDEFAPGLDNMISTKDANAEASRKFWGCVQWLFQQSISEGKYFEDIANMFDQMDGFAPPHMEIKPAMISSSLVQARLGDLYGLVLQCCIAAAKVMLKKEGFRMKLMRKHLNMKESLSVPLRRFESQRTEFIKVLQAVDVSKPSQRRQTSDPPQMPVPPKSQQQQPPVNQRPTKSPLNRHSTGRMNEPRTFVKTRRSSGFYMPPGPIPMDRNILERLVDEQIRTDNQNASKPESIEGIRQQIEKAIQPPEYKNSLIQAAYRTNAMATWIKKQPSFLEWTRGRMSGCAWQQLWIHGPPGIGKTALAAAIVSYMQVAFPMTSHTPSRRTAVCYAFITSTNQAGEALSAVLKCFIAQLIHQTHDLPTLRTAATKSTSSSSLTLRSIEEIFTSLAKYFTRIFVIVDGLDHAANPEHYVKFLLKLSNLNVAIKLLIVSQKVTSLEDELSLSPAVAVTKLPLNP